LSLNVVIETEGGERISCSFTGGLSTPVRVTGSYRTTDERIHRALEKHPWFNVEYFLQNTIVRDRPIQKEPEKKPEIKKEPSGDGRVSEAVSAQEAREELNKTYGVPFSKLRNTDQIIAKADELGIKYPKWLKE